jgi:carbonic anhydrase
MQAVMRRAPSAVILAAVLASGGLWMGCGNVQQGVPSRPAGGRPARASRRPQTAAEALDELRRGNQRFLAGRPRHPDEDEAWRDKLVEGQHPFVTLLGCSDSRIPPELLFDQGFGDMFVIRVAGNVLDPFIEGSIEYGVHHLHTPLLLVLGHEDCGAVKAALASAQERAQEPREIQKLVEALEPSFRALTGADNPTALVHAAVEANVQRAVEELRRLPALEESLREGKLLIIGGVYELATGRVNLLPYSSAAAPK